jgi:hypothetical protein
MSRVRFYFNQFPHFLLQVHYSLAKLNFSNFLYSYLIVIPVFDCVSKSYTGSEVRGMIFKLICVIADCYYYSQRIASGNLETRKVGYNSAICTAKHRQLYSCRLQGYGCTLPTSALPSTQHADSALLFSLNSQACTLYCRVRTEGIV